VRHKKDMAAFCARYHPQIRRYIASSVRSPADVDDLVQDVFIEFLRDNSPRDPKNYIFAVARSVVSRYRLEKANRPRIMQIGRACEIPAARAANQHADPLAQLSPRQLRKIIECVTAQLPPKACEAVKLRFVEGLSSKEAAQKAGCSLSAFWKRLQRATKTLRQIASKSDIIENP
jgi:RNA polymerase sigma factor (sigma-70 family)